MARLDNPAGRLHAFLSQYRAAAEEDRSIQHTWLEVLEVEQQRDVAVVLAEVASLVPAIRAAVNRSGDEDQLNTFEHYGAIWAEAVMAPHHLATQTPSPGKKLVDAGALAALGSLSAFLSATQSEGTIPDAGSLEELRDFVQEAIDVLAEADDLPFDVRRLILGSLHDVLWALDRLRIGGPGAVQAAVEHLAFSVVTAPDEARRTPAVGKAMAAGGAVYRAFMTAPAVRNSMEAVGQIFGVLTSGLGG